MNNGTWIVNLGADPEALTLGGRELYKLRCADKTPGKKSITRWFTALVGGPDIDTASRLAKGNTIALAGTLTQTEYKSTKPRYKGEMIRTDEIPFAKILQVIRSDTFFGTGDTGDFPPKDDAVVVDDTATNDTPPELEGL